MTKSCFIVPTRLLVVLRCSRLQSILITHLYYDTYQYLPPFIYPPLPFRRARFASRFSVRVRVTTCLMLRSVHGSVVTLTRR